MIKQLLKYKFYIAVILLLIIVEPIINSILNFWLQRIFSVAQPGADKLMIMRLLTIGFMLWIVKRAMSFISSVIKSRFICNAKQDVKHKIFIKLLSLNSSSIPQEYESGEYISVFTNDIVLLETRFYEQIINLISGIISVIILGSSFIALDMKLGGAILAFGMVTMLVPALFSKRLNKKSLEYSETISSFTQKLKEYTTAYPTIKNYSIEQKISQLFDRKNQDTEDAKFEADYMLALANNVGMLLAWFMQFIAVGFGIILVVKGEIVIGTIVAAQSFANDIALPLQSVISNVNSIKSVKEIVKKLDKMSGGSTDGNSAAAPVGSPDFKKSVNNIFSDGCDITFNNLQLVIENQKIINDFTFTFEKGKKYLMVGINGAGKSSVFKALKKWYNNCSGTITINGLDISLLKNEDLSHIISYLNENVSVFSGSVKDNISLFRSHSDESFENAVNAAQIKLDLDRIISDDGRNISSGEKRRIEIARSLLESVKVLIFDEVVSTLDIETAYEIEKLALSFKDKTVIFISHNFSGKLIKEYDEILVMDKGHLIAHGSYDELLSGCDYFRKICDIKFG